MTASVISAGDLVGRIGEEFDDELHLSGDEARALAAHIERLEVAQVDRVAAIQALRNWARKKFGPWITWRTATAAVDEILSARSSLNQDGGKP